LGEDGPTHQSIEHAASLRLIPNLDVWRPADTAETTAAWESALREAQRPTALLLSRQNCAYAAKSADAAKDIARGAYVLAEPKKGKAKAAIIATGSEVQLALQAQALLAERGIGVRVVSMPCTQAFDRQDRAYQSSVLPANLPRIAVEAGVSAFWWKYGCAAVVGIDTYGESAPAPVLFEHFGFTAKNVADAVHKALLK
jgi:transketolase